MLLVLVDNSLGAGCTLPECLPCEAHLRKAAELAPDHVGHWP